jgi:UDP-N-acetylmuramoyl-tripeptide--D-alanyl-D-alanine ligase
MSALSVFALVFLYAGALAFIAKRLLRYLRYLQQDDYSTSRFIHWLKTHSAYDTRGTLAAVVALVVETFLNLSQPLLLGLNLVVAVVLFSIGYSEKDPRFEGKKKLNLTKRARMIYVVALTLGALLIAVLFLMPLPRFFSLILICQSPALLLVCSVILLQPRERALQAKLKREANQKFMSIAPRCIGVTGSFGKTSVKNMLGEILSMSLAPTFYPQAGVNTEMGITREIREHMNNSHRYAVIEMGAYHEGSIARLCNLTPVSAAIVTAVHLMHLERFGGEDQVYRAKSELPRALGGMGVLVVNGDNPGARKMATEFRAPETYIYGLEATRGARDAELSDIKTGRHGTEFLVTWRGRSYPGFVKMHGRSALSNLLGSFTMAVALGADPELVLAVARNLQPVSNRLEVKDYGEYIQINDAYNSNPEGFGCALEVLKDLPGKRRILITPGMIELGDRQYEENKKIAKLVAGICDLVFVVNEENRRAFQEGLTEAGRPAETVLCFEKRDQALSYLTKIRLAGDIVLLENDLPDLHEFSEKF